MARREVVPADDEANSDAMIDAVAGFYSDPLGYVLFAFPWGEKGTPLEDELGPDEWQYDVLDDLGKELRKRDANPQMPAIQMAVKSGNGIGKTTLHAWIILWHKSCRNGSYSVTTANTLPQLTGKTWRELSKWHGLAINGSWFQWTATRFYHKQLPQSRRAEAVPWTKERSEGFQGSHAESMLLIFDEASSIPDEIWVAGDGAMTTQGAIWLVFGNPTRNKGRFRQCFRELRHRWRQFTVDSRQARKSQKAQLATWVADYGEDSDFVRVKVRGEFPRAATTQLIPEDLVVAAREQWKRRVPIEALKRAIAEGPAAVRKLRNIDPNPVAPWLLTCDVARYGNDQTVFGLRIGKTFVVLTKYRGLGVDQVAARLIDWIMGLSPDATFIDGGGVGGGVVDLVEAAGHAVQTVMGGSKARDERKYFNRRSEMWMLTKMWLADGGAVPDDDKEIGDDLTGPEYGFDAKYRLQLETKEDMTARGLPSPDTADALTMSFSVQIAPRIPGAGDSVQDRLDKYAAGYGHNSGATTWMSH